MAVRRKKKQDTSIPDDLFFLAAALVVVLDQFNKALVTRAVGANESITVIPGLLDLTLVHNTGAGFGLLPGMQWFLVGFAVLVIAGIVYMHKHIIADQLRALFFALILGGAIGNLIDRLRVGAVIDFLDLGFWPAFNLADVALVAGVIGLVVYSWRTEKSERLHGSSRRRR